MPGNKILKKRHVVIRDDKIERITLKNLQLLKNVYKGAQVIDGEGKFLMPGLFDAHVHLSSRSFFSLFLAHGITAIREVGSTKKDIFSLRDKVNAGTIQGPRMFIAGPILEGDPPFWKGFRIVQDKSKGRTAIKDLKRRGADFIKVYHTLKPEVYQVILDEAHKQNLKVTGHLPKSINVIDAIKMGQDGLEHMYDISTYVTTIISKNAYLKNYPKQKRFVEIKIDRSKLEKLGSILKRSNVSICPTLVVDKKISQLADYAKLKQSKEARYLPKHYREIDWNPKHPKSSINIRSFPPLYFKNLGLLYERTQYVLPFLQKCSNILAGSDTPNPFVVPGFSLLEELRLLVKAGLKPYQALECATYNPAKFLNVLPQLGTVEPGKLANLLLLRSNPLEHISNIDTIEGIFLNGRYLSKTILQKNMKRINLDTTS